MIQNTLTYLLVAAALGIVLYKLWQSLFGPKTSSCEGCSGCDLKKEIHKNKTMRNGCTPLPPDSSRNQPTNDEKSNA